jgi:hypothetical protein
MMTMTSRVERIQTATAGPTDASTQRDIDGDAPLIPVSSSALIAGVVEDTLGERRKCLGQ